MAWPRSGASADPPRRPTRPVLRRSAPPIHVAVDRPRGSPCVAAPRLRSLDAPGELPGPPARASQLKDWHEYPKWKPADLRRYFPGLEPAGIDLMRRLFEYDPAKRISAKEALEHPYFDDIDRAALDAMENPELL